MIFRLSRSCQNRLYSGTLAAGHLGKRMVRISVLTSALKNATPVRQGHCYHGPIRCSVHGCAPHCVKCHCTSCTQRGRTQIHKIRSSNSDRMTKVNPVSKPRSPASRQAPTIRAPIVGSMPGVLSITLIASQSSCRIRKIEGWPNF